MMVMSSSSLLRRLGATEEEVQAFEASLTRLLDINLITAIRHLEEAHSIIENLLGTADSLMIQDAPNLSRASRFNSAVEIFGTTLEPVIDCKLSANSDGKCSGNGHGPTNSNPPLKIHCLHKSEPAVPRS